MTPIYVYMSELRLMDMPKNEFENFAPGNALVNRAHRCMSKTGIVMASIVSTPSGCWGGG